MTLKLGVWIGCEKASLQQAYFAELIDVKKARWREFGAWQMCAGQLVRHIWRRFETAAYCTISI